MHRVSKRGNRENINNSNQPFFDCLPETKAKHLALTAENDISSGAGFFASLRCARNDRVMRCAQNDKLLYLLVNKRIMTIDAI